jgi:hypothetical protein
MNEVVVVWSSSISDRIKEVKIFCGGFFLNYYYLEKHQIEIVEFIIGSVPRD